MKKWMMFFASLILLVMSVGTPKSYAWDKLTSATFDSVKIYYGMGRAGFTTGALHVTVLTPGEVAYGVYNTTGYIGTDARVVSWTGSGPAPTLTLVDYSSTDNSFCPGINTTLFRCAYETFKVTVQSDNYGCPWIASFYEVSDQHAYGIYTGPTDHATACPTIPVTSFDISWNENYVSHSKALQLQSNGSTITTTLSTYLMQDGKLCDGSVFDTRGAYCRVVSELLTFTSYGCDKSTVTVSPTRHPVTDKQLHDIVVKVNTSSRQPIDSTCRFQYVLNEL
ncbi:TPA: DUF2544 domain-containing protein [Escherichia coli]|nr:DUF2544 domain-containing protein [Escherichia coli]HBA9580877.1 DUF2544 domain-containing protein [Escherichia coli]HBA9585123.1 DUF2544 domain-containing protein [Escherichia coli]